MKTIAHSNIPAKDVHDQGKQCQPTEQQYEVFCKKILKERIIVTTITIFSRCQGPSEEYHHRCKVHHIRHDQREADLYSAPLQIAYQNH